MMNQGQVSIHIVRIIGALLLYFWLPFLYVQADELKTSVQLKYFDEMVFNPNFDRGNSILHKWDTPILVGVHGEVSESQLNIASSVFMELGEVSAVDLEMAAPWGNQRYGGNANVFIIASENLEKHVDEKFRNLIIPGYLGGRAELYPAFKKENLPTESGCHGNIGILQNQIFQSLIFVRLPIDHAHFRKCIIRFGISTMGLLGEELTIPTVKNAEVNNANLNAYEKWVLSALYSSEFTIGQSKASVMETLKATLQ